MEVEIAVPHVPPTLAPGTRTTVPVEVRNPSSDPVQVRLSLARGRAGDWAQVEPATADLPPGGHRSIDVIFTPPADASVEAAMIPFTLRAVDAVSTSPLGSATGLVQMTGPQWIDATLTAEVGTAAVGRFALWLRNRGTDAVRLTLAARLEPGGGADVEPATVDVAPGGTVTARVTTRPRRRLTGAPAAYGVTVTAAGGWGQTVTARADGAAPARTGAPIVLTLLVAAVLAAGFLVLRSDSLRWPFRDDATPTSTGATAPAAVRRPYVMVASYPQLGPEDRASAEATVVRLTAAGLPVRLVDSKTSDDVADGTDGFWVVLQDGFPSADEARAACARYRGVTPQCEIVP